MADTGFTLPRPDGDAQPVDLEEFTAPIGGLDAVMPLVIDLDRLRARRAEGSRRPATSLTVAGETFALPPELPLGVLDAFGRLSIGDMQALGDALRLLWPDVTGTGPDPEWIEANPHALEAEAPLVEVVLESPSNRLLYHHGLTIEDFQEVLEQVIGRYGIAGGVPS